MHNSTSSSHPPIAPPTTASTDWFLELDLPGAYYASIMKSIMLSIPNFLSRVPDNSFILSDRNEVEGKPAGDKLIQGMKGKGWAMVHLPYGGSVEIDLNEALDDGEGGEGGKYRGWWIDPKTGGREIFEEGEIKGKKEFKSPSEGSLKTDWLLYIESVSSTPAWFTGKQI